MSAIANWLMNLAQSAANMRDSKLRIRIKNGRAEWYYRPKDSEKEVWEDHYENVAFYFGNNAIPTKFEVEGEEPNNRNTLDIQENAITTKYYNIFMQQEALERMFNVKGAKRDTMIKILYAIGGGVIVILIMQLAMYGGGF